MAHLTTPMYDVFDFPTTIQRTGMSTNDAVRVLPSLDPFQALHLLRNNPRLVRVSHGRREAVGWDWWGKEVV